MKKQEQTTAKNLIEQITVNRLDDIISQKKFVLIDVRPPEAIASQGAIPGAHNLPYDKVDRVLQDWQNDPKSIFQSKKPLLFCCTGGVMSYASAIKAKEKGVNPVYNLEGGHAAWASLKKEQAA